MGSWKHLSVMLVAKYVKGIFRTSTQPSCLLAMWGTDLDLQFKELVLQFVTHSPNGSLSSAIPRIEHYLTPRSAASFACQPCRALAKFSTL